MELLALRSAARSGGRSPSVTADAEIVTADLAARGRAPRASVVPRSRAHPGTNLGHDVLLALIMAVAMAATVFLYR